MNKKNLTFILCNVIILAITTFNVSSIVLKQKAKQPINDLLLKTTKKTMCNYDHIGKRVLQYSNVFRKNPNQNLLKLLKQNKLPLKKVPKYQTKPPMVWSDILTKIAKTHASNMANGKVKFGHDGFKNRYLALAAWAKNNGKFVNTFAENVGYTSIRTNLAQFMVNGWVLDIGIPDLGHRKNLLSDNHYMGAAVCQNAKGRWYFVQLFANY
ncbi:MAG: CAP domain-containing protein [Candidatus Babeliales bacterium]|nr:CAP domain-containing protein [Candidatus Babeliales bacterium]